MDAAFLRLFFFTLGTCVRSHELFQNLQFVLSNVKQETTNGYPFMVSCDDKGRLILSGAKERDLALVSHGVNHVYNGLLSISFEKRHNLSGLCT